MQKSRTKSLYERMKPEFKLSVAKSYEGRPHSHAALIKMLSDEYYFTAVPYGDAYDIMTSCELDFLGDAFKTWD